MTHPVSTTQLIAIMQDSRNRTLELVHDLEEEQLMGPKLRTVNPLKWEIAHAAYFYEFFILRMLYGYDSVIGRKADELYDSIKVNHDVRWDLPLPNMKDTLAYMQAVFDRLAEHLDQTQNHGMASEQDSFIYQFGIFHEDMHTEAFLWARQTLAYRTPNLALAADVSTERKAGGYPGWAEVPGGKFNLGATRSTPFLFDNEKWAHEITIMPFEIAKAPVTNREFQIFLNSGGYTNETYWDFEGWKWRQETGSSYPCYWQPDGSDNWVIRRFEKILPLPLDEPIIHINWHEANAYCRWAGQRLPTEAEWEAAALGTAGSHGGLTPEKRRFPWGDTPPDPTIANLLGRGLGPSDVAALPFGDSAFGCRQMLGNIWEWTADTFQAYPGFSADAYKEYSTMLFGSTKVLRGGAWTTRSRMMHGTYRNYFEPHRSDVFSGFRTCKISSAT